jgi:hypothetical protein
MDRARKIVLYLKAEGWRPPAGDPDAFEKAQEYFAQEIADELAELWASLRQIGESDGR